MKREIIICDVCGHEFTGNETWEKKPVTIKFFLSHPRQIYESQDFDHVCWSCVEILKSGFYAALKLIKK